MTVNLPKATCPTAAQVVSIQLEHWAILRYSSPADAAKRMKIGGTLGRSMMAALLPFALSLSLPCTAEPENDEGFVALQVDAKKSFKEVITPFVDNYCTRCHGQDRQRGGINFGPALKKPGESASSQRWKQALAVVKSHKMPPDSTE